MYLPPVSGLQTFIDANEAQTGKARRPLFYCVRGRGSFSWEVIRILCRQGSDRQEEWGFMHLGTYYCVIMGSFLELTTATSN